MKRFYGFTLAEVLITLAIIGVVAAISIPSVISNTQQQEFKTGLRKAVSVLNSAITMNMAIDGETPYDNANLMGFFMKRMASTPSFYVPSKFMVGVSGQEGRNGWPNYAFYTNDGMRFEFWGNDGIWPFKLHENPKIKPCIGSLTYAGSTWYDEGGGVREHKSCGGCGSYGLNNNPNGTTKPPCVIMVDVNGDRKPNPNNVNCKKTECAKPYKYSDTMGLKLTDLFSIMITDKEAIPFGVAAQRAMYQAQAKK